MNYPGGLTLWWAINIHYHLMWHGHSLETLVSGLLDESLYRTLEVDLDQVGVAAGIHHSLFSDPELTQEFRERYLFRKAQRG